MDVALYYHTLRHLRPVQIYRRPWFHLWRPRPDLAPCPPRRPATDAWVASAPRRPGLLGPTRCRFLQQEGDLTSPCAWNDPRRARLWLYHLHYFDDLNATGAPARSAWHRALLARWVAENPPGRGVGWEPYPTSLRIVNWVKWALAGNPLEPPWVHSLAVQARWLRRRLEYHLLGNHLLANAKALCFAGAFFAGPEAEGWLRRGLALLERELAEQVLADGGHCERSPLYHAIVCEDLLDLLDLARAFPGPLATAAVRWRQTAARMGAWLLALCHPDGEIALFNDAAFGVAPTPAALAAYARRLGLPPWPAPADGLTHLAASGYLRLQRGPAVALLDVAPIGPDHQPGHAHADTLSFELSLHGRRLVVNSGTSLYDDGPERRRQRGTAAHSTVQVDDADSSQVWGGFRVARRARPFDLRLERGADTLRVSCAHDGYRRLPGRPVHRRTWSLSARELRVHDTVEGRFTTAVAHFHLHPAATPLPGPAPEAGELRPTVAWRALRGMARLSAGSYHPEMGLCLPNHCLAVTLAEGACAVRFSWRSADAHPVSDRQLPP